MSPLLANSLKRFFSHYLPVQKGLSENTVLSYRDATKLLLNYAADRWKKSVDELCVEDIDESLVLTFLDHLDTVRSCSPRTRRLMVRAQALERKTGHPVLCQGDHEWIRPARWNPDLG